MPYSGPEYSSDDDLLNRTSHWGQDSEARAVTLLNEARAEKVPAAPTPEQVRASLLASTTFPVVGAEYEGKILNTTAERWLIVKSRDNEYDFQIGARPNPNPANGNPESIFRITLQRP